MTVDLDKLEALAGAATPGPWQRGQQQRGFVDGKYAVTGVAPKNADDVSIMAGDRPVVSGCGCCNSPDGRGEDGDYIAAASPDVVLALIAELRAARPIVEAAREFTRRSVEGYSDGDLNELRWSVDGAR